MADEWWANTFNAGTEGGGVTVGNSGGGNGDALHALAAGTGGSIQYRAAAAVEGARGARVTPPTSGNSQMRYQVGTARADRCGAEGYLFYRGATTSSGAAFITLRNGSTAAAGLRGFDGGGLRVYRGSTALAASLFSAAVASTWYRVGVYHVPLGGGQCQIEMYVDDVDGTNLHTWVSPAGACSTQAVDFLRFDSESAATVGWSSVDWDLITAGFIETGRLPNPLHPPDPEPATDQVLVSLDGAWAPATPLLTQGGAWEPVTLT